MRLRSGLIVLVATLGVVPLGAQTPRGLDAARPAAEALDRARDLHQRMQPREAMDLYRSLVERYPENPEVLAGAAGEAVTLGILAGEKSDALRWYREAEEYARRAVAEAPEMADAHYWLAAALGRRSLEEDPGERVELARPIRRHAREALALDSAHAGAHHVLGMWHAEVERVGGVSRFFAEHLLGGDVFGEASWEEALIHLERAVELEPRMLLFRLELARALLDVDRTDEAMPHLRVVLEDATTQPVDPLMKQRAQELLKSIQ